MRSEHICTYRPGFRDPDGNTWAVQELRVRSDKPLIPPQHRGRFGA